MKRAFVLSEQGVCNVYFVRDEHPRIQWLIDLGVPNFACFMLELPIPEDNPAHVQIVFNEGTALLLQQIKVFLEENEFGSDAGVLQAIMDAIHRTDIDYTGTDTMYGYEILFTLSSEFYQLVQNRLVKQKFAARPSEIEISKAVWRGPDTSKRVVTQEWEKGMVQKKDKKQLQDAKAIIDRYKQTIYKNTPGPLYVIMYDRNGMPRGVSRVTNRGLTKWAAGWGQWIRGEYWLDAESGHAVECDQGDHNHVSYATEYIEDSKRDEIVAAFHQILPEAEEKYPGEAEQEFEAVRSGEMFSRDSLLWEFLPMEEVERLYDGDYDLFSKDIRAYFMKHYNQIHVIDNHFGVWSLNSRNLSAIIDWIFEQADGAGADPEQMDGDAFIEQIGDHKWTSLPVRDLIHMKHPGQVWRTKGMSVASKTAAHDRWASWWITPDGNSTEVADDEEHWEAAAKMMGVENPTDDALIHLIPEALDRGWIRVSLDMPYLYLEAKRWDRQTLHNAQTFAMSLGGVQTVVMEESNQKPRSAELPVDDFLTLNNPDKAWRLSRVAAVAQLPHEVEVKLPLHILNTLTEQAAPFDPKAEFRFVGGCVRDMLLGRKPKDVDVVTNTTAQTLQQMGLENVGKAFPVYLYHDDQYGQIEVAVARAEEKTGLGHKGFDTIPTGNFEDDVVRRDLNINAMMVDREGRLYGPEEALENIQSKTFQNVSQKFAEDPLRVFRVARFAAQFGDGWVVSPQLTDLMREMQPELETLPADRIREETRRALNGKQPLRFFEVLREADCLDPWFQELHTNWDGTVISVEYGAEHHWGFEQQIVGLASQLDNPDSLINRLGLSDQIRRAAQYVKQNRHLIETARRLSKPEVVQLIQKGWRGAIGFDQLIACALVGGRSEEGRYLLACAEQMKRADMTGVTNKSEATERLVSAISKQAGGPQVEGQDYCDRCDSPFPFGTTHTCPGGRKTAMSLAEAVEEAAEQVQQELAARPKPWETPAFKQWFGNSKVVNRDGSPKRVMHGTTHVFEEFAPKGQNEENWYGPGYYFTDCPQDASENYGVNGPDLTSRIEQLAERIVDDYEYNEAGEFGLNPDLDDVEESEEEEFTWNSPTRQKLRELAAAKAKELIAGQTQGHVVPVFLRIENPVIVTEQGGTRLPGGDSGFTNEDDEDEWVDGEGDIRLYEAWEALTHRFDAYQPDEKWGEISEFVIDHGGITAAQFESLIRGSDTFIDNEGGNGPVLRYFYDLLGYDGIIMDASVFKDMRIKKGTRHYVVWDPKQIKSAIGNKGTFDPKSPLLTAAVKSTKPKPADPIEEVVIDETPNVTKQPGPSAEDLDLARSLADKRISPAVPTAVLKPGQIDPHSHAHAQPNLERLMQNERFEHNVNLAVEHYPNFKYLRGERFKDYTAQQKAEEIINHMAANLVWLYKTWGEDVRDRAKLWYVGGNRIIHRWSEEFGVEPHKIAAVVAALSPQAHWFQNVTTAERVIEAIVRMKDFRWDSKMDRVALDRGWAPEEMEAEMREAIGKAAAPKPKEPKVKMSTKIAIPLIRNKTLREVLTENPAGTGREYLASVWIRAWAEAHTPNLMREVTPEGAFGDTFRSGKNTVKVKWTSFAAISKAVMILESNSLSDISRLIGANHKVRSFYNNLIAPMADEGDVTIDTHAVAAALIRPLSGASVEVLHNFGSAVLVKPDKNGKYWRYNEDDDEYEEITEEEARQQIPNAANSAVTGLNGLYALYAEAYRRAAKDPSVRVLPRELQSVTWEAIRALFNPLVKRNKQLKNNANAVWAAHDPSDGGKSAEEARNEILSLVKGGFETPSWHGADHGLHEDAQHSSYKRELSQPLLPGSGGQAAPTGVGGGASARNQGRGGVTSSLLAPKTAEIRFYSEVTGAHHNQTDVSLTARSGNMVVGRIDYSIFDERVHIRYLKIGNDVLDAIEAKKLMSPRLRYSKDLVARLGHAMMQQIQRENEGMEILLRWDDDVWKGLPYDERPSEDADKFARLEALDKEWAKLNGELMDFDSRGTRPSEEWWDRYSEVEYERGQLQWDLEDKKPTKRIIRTSALLQRQNS